MQVGWERCLPLHLAHPVFHPDTPTGGFDPLKKIIYLESQDAIEVMLITDRLIVSTYLTDVTLVSDDS